MNIYLIRHATAEDHSNHKSDFTRELTSDGIKKMETAVKAWQNFLAIPDLLVTSPLIRAVQTAEIVKKVLHIKNELVIDRRLSLGSRTESIVEIANEFSVENIAMFGHEPDFSTHVSNLISNSGARINFRKGAIAKISFSNQARISCGTLEFLIPARIFRD